MILDDWQSFSELDPGGMLSEIERLPDQLQEAWELGNSLPLPEWTGFQQIVIAGMGGSAIGGDLLRSYALPTAPVPVIVWRNYGLPAFAQGSKTLIICSSHSGNTEEVLSAFDKAVEVEAQILVVTRGGELGTRALREGIPHWAFQHQGQPRAAVGYSFGLLLAALSRLGIIPDPTAELSDAINQMRKIQEKIGIKLPAVNNPAKRLAGQFMGRWSTIIGADHLTPVARRWRTQISEIAKAVAQFEELPEADHNMVAGIEMPEVVFGNTMVLFLRGNGYHPRNLARTDATKQLFMLEGMNTNMLQASGESRMAEQWTSLHFGDYVAYYLAMAYGVDPTPVHAIEDLKRQLLDT
ncbi:MAG: bifunctional phosphoglucose/phosphomannose isomerase [Anaerolineales bacterium]|jgi:glucose/mannose-6-phosphate isomerase